MSCFSCGKTFNGSVNDLLQLYKREYLTKGVERYFFRLKTNGDVKIIHKDQFKNVFDSQIKPNFKNGAEYAHIREYKTD
ncbi:MAG: hypothetical protein HRU26_05645 [Psychroserpens sp.]|nr:hypothetical protein [Psychroserpens sp.]